MNRYTDESHGVTFRIVGRTAESAGRLEISLDAATLATYREAVATGSFLRPADFAEAIEPVLCNSEWDFVRPDEIGALVADDTPILSPDMVRADDGDIVAITTVYYYGSYALRDPLEDLLRAGQVVLDGELLETTPADQ